MRRVGRMVAVLSTLALAAATVAVRVTAEEVTDVPTTAGREVHRGAVTITALGLAG